MTEETRPETGSVNYGIQVGSGGSFQANAVAVGPHAQARSDASGASLADDPSRLAEIRTQVAQLLTELTTRVDRRGGVADADALAAVQEGAAELAKEQPERSVVVTAFTRAAAGITSLGALAGSLQSILQLLGVR